MLAPFNVYRPASAFAFALATASIYFGVGTSFLPSATREEANQVWIWFFSAWAVALLMVGLTRMLTVRARQTNKKENPKRLRWTDAIIALEGAICVFYLLSGISARIEGR